ncbi:hypothetical protein Spiaf_1458 [Spirochaeta africana DSM 8902]|uniref:Bacterial sensory transduction regulator n=2 Tax=Spirochaeta TaxID=146 RepID=H9UJ28_SPIAZ|nr:hypothetical protein Spiaf_1458 [Spirochaeta africana DSM 8902]
MKERIRRVTLLFKELGYNIESEEYDEDAYTAGFHRAATPGGFIYIDRECRFLELAYTFLFSARLGAFLRAQMSILQDICYEFGCYYVVRTEGEDIIFTIHSKLYYAGLNYFSLKETLRDLTTAVQAVEEQVGILFDPDIEGSNYEGS